MSVQTKRCPKCGAMVTANTFMCSICRYAFSTYINNQKQPIVQGVGISNNGNSLSFAKPILIMVTVGITASLVLFGVSKALHGSESHQSNLSVDTNGDSSSINLPNGPRFTVWPKIDWGGINGYEPMAGANAQNDLIDYQDACGSLTTPGLRGSLRSNPEFRQQLISEGRIVMLRPGTRVIQRGEMGTCTLVCVAEGPYMGQYGQVFSTTLEVDMSGFGIDQYPH